MPLSLRHARTLFSVALALAATTVAERRAHAYAWYCQVVDGQDSPTSLSGGNPYFATPAAPSTSVYGPFGGAVASPVAGATSAVLWDGYTWPFYTFSYTYNSNTSQWFRVGWDVGWPISNPNWDLFTWDGPGYTDNVDVNGPASLVWQNGIWLAYTDADANILVAPPSGFGPGTGERLTLNPGAYGGTEFGIPWVTPSMAALGSNLYVFYDTMVWNTALKNWVYELHYARTDGTNWTYDQYLTGQAHSNAVGPAAASINGKLAVFYAQNNQLMEQWSTDGSTWHTATVDASHSAGSTNISTLVEGSTLYVFYQDTALESLLVMTQNAAGAWSGPTIVDGAGSPYGVQSGNIGVYSAPVIQTSSAQVYYTDDTRHQIRGAWTDGTNWYPTVIDGAGTASLCDSPVYGGGGATGNALGGPIAVTQAPNGEGPHVFYADTTRGNLREAYQY